MLDLPFAEYGLDVGEEGAIGQDARLADTVDAEHAHRRFLDVTAQEVPGGRLDEQAVGLDRAFGRGAAAIDVVEGEAQASGEALLDSREEIRGHLAEVGVDPRRSRATDDDALAERAEGAGALLRQAREHLVQPTLGSVVPGQRRGGRGQRRCQPQGNELVEREVDGDDAAVALQADAAAWPRLRFDRHAVPAQRGEIAQHRPLADAEVPGELLHGGAFAGAQEGLQIHHSIDAFQEDLLR